MLYAEKNEKIKSVPYFDLTRQYNKLKPEFDAAIRNVIESGRFIMGDDVKLLEGEFSSYCGAKYGIGVNSGTDALFIGLQAIGIKAPDEVITVSYTYIATALAVSFTGAKPVFVEPDPATYCIDPKTIEKAVTKNTKAILVVHLYGHPVDMDPVLAIAKKRGLLVMEDSAQAHGAEYKGKRVGSLADISGFSFFPTKNLGAFGDGGMITTSNAEFADKARLLRDYGRKVRDHHIIKGRNSRLDTLQAAVLRVKLKRLDDFNSSRRRLAGVYNEMFKSAGDKIIVPKEADYAKHVYHLYVIRVKNRDAVVAGLKERGVPTLVHYPIPIHLQEAFSDLGYKKGSLPITEKICDEIISLPMFPEMTEEEVRYAAGQVLSLVS
jgi:dTDP-4-amino-4,6-dideoxygalactose transaminase